LVKEIWGAKEKRNKKTKERDQVQKQPNTFKGICGKQK